MFYLEEKYAQEMIAHAKEEAPNECCGILAGKEGRIVHLYRAKNAANSPVRYNLDPKELLKITNEIEGNGWELLGIYHSHVNSEAYPSPIDIKLAFWSQALYFIISLKPPEPVIRAFHIVEGKVKEEEVSII
jgi:proteasome lid subunit RPN8/RPN11